MRCQDQGLNSSSADSTNQSTGEPASLRARTSKGGTTLDGRMTGELQTIQALRAIAATSVVLYHIPFIGRGAFGVDVFFVISGFIICYISSLNSENFLLKRIFRIVPLYWLGTLGVLLIAIVMPALLNSTTVNLDSLVKSLLFIPYRRVDGTSFPLLFLGWTLEYEMFFYLLFGLSLAVFKKRASLAASAAFMGLVAAGTAFRASSTIPRFYSNPLILEFVFGMAAFAIWKRYRNSFPRFPLAAAFLVSAGCYAFLYVSSDWVDRSNRLLLEGLPAVILVLCFLTLEGRARFSKWLLIVGDASYSLYLFHPYVIQLVDKKIVALSVLTPLSLAASVGAILACFLLAILSFRVVELPSNRFLRRNFLNARPRVTNTRDRESADAGSLARLSPALEDGSLVTSSLASVSLPLADRDSIGQATQVAESE